MITSMRSLTREEAKRKLEEKYPNLKVKASVDLNANYFVFAAVEDENQRNYIGPMYSVNKKDGKIEFYHPNADIENFSRACDNSMVEY
jgi:hypothetical protein